MITRKPSSTLFPYTTLFRSIVFLSLGAVNGTSRKASSSDGVRSHTASLVTPGMSTEYPPPRSEEHTSELQSQSNLVCRLLLEKKKCYCNRYSYFRNWLNFSC